jgi:ABC-2 type transport system permease protein
MNMTLFKTMTKIQLRDIMSYSFGAILYQWLIIWIYPSVAKSGINDLLKSMPESMLKAIGMGGGIQKLGDFLAGEFYGLLYLLLMIVFTLMTSIRLIAKLIDRGSMAYLLSTPVSRVKIVTTQIMVLTIGLFTISVFTTLGGITGSRLFVEHSNLDSGAFIQMNIVGFLLFLLVGGYSFVFSCLINDEKKAMGVVACITIVFYACNLVSKMSDKLDWLKYVSIFTVFNPQEIMRGNYNIIPGVSGLAIASILLFILSIAIFKRRDLPL